MKQFYPYLFVFLFLLSCESKNAGEAVSNAAAGAATAAASETPPATTAPATAEIADKAVTRQKIDSLEKAITEFEVRYKKKAQLLNANLNEKEKLSLELQDAKDRQANPALIKRLENKIEELDDKILTYESRISLMSDTLRLFSTIINFQGKMLMQRDERIEALENQVSMLEKDNAVLKQENTQLKERILQFESIPRGADFKFNEKYFSYGQDIFYVNFESKEYGKPLVDNSETRENLARVKRLILDNPGLKVQLIAEATTDVDRQTRIRGAQGRAQRLKEYMIKEMQIAESKIKLVSNIRHTNNTHVAVQVVR